VLVNVLSVFYDVTMDDTYEIEWPSEKRFDLGAVHDPCWQRNNYFSEETFVSWKE
jgi:hypothetical protein